MEKANISRAQQFFTILVTCTSPLCKRHATQRIDKPDEYKGTRIDARPQRSGSGPSTLWWLCLSRSETTKQHLFEFWARLGGKWNRTHPESRTPPARLGDKWIGKDKWIGRHPESWTPPAKLGDKRRETVKTHSRRAGHHQPDWATNQLGDWETHDFEERQPESRTPPARLGNKSIGRLHGRHLEDMRRAGHREPDWERNE